MSLSARQLVEIRRRTRAELLEAGVIDLKDIFSKEDIKLMESVRFEARHLVSKINRATLLSEDASGNVGRITGHPVVFDAHSEEVPNGEKAAAGRDSAGGAKDESLIEKLFIKFTKQILLFAVKLLREYVGAGAKIGSAFWTHAFEKTILRVLKFLGLSDESAKKAKDFVSELVYHAIDLFGHGKTLDFAISAIEDAKPDKFEDVGRASVKFAKEKMKNNEVSAGGAKGGEASAGDAGTTSESLNRLNKEIVILERRFRNQKRIR
jgi:hypothetical protein